MFCYYIIPILLVFDDIIRECGVIIHREIKWLGEDPIS